MDKDTSDAGSMDAAVAEPVATSSQQMTTVMETLATMQKTMMALAHKLDTPSSPPAKSRTGEAPPPTAAAKDKREGGPRTGDSDSSTENSDSEREDGEHSSDAAQQEQMHSVTDVIALDDDDAMKALWTEVDSALPVTDEKLAPPVNESLATRLQMMWDKTIPYQNKKALIEETYGRRPKNLTRMVVPELPSELEEKMLKTKADKKNDEKLVHCQKTVVATAFAIAAAADHVVECMNSKAQVNGTKIVTDLVQASNLLGQTNCMLSERRRHQLKHVVSSEYKSICTQKIETGPCIFGEDWMQKLKDTKTVEKSVRDVLKDDRKTYKRDRRGFLDSRPRGYQSQTPHYHPYNQQPLAHAGFTKSYGDNNRPYMKGGRGRGRQQKKPYKPQAGQ